MRMPRSDRIWAHEAYLPKGSDRAILGTGAVFARALVASEEDAMWLHRAIDVRSLGFRCEDTRRHRGRIGR